jgi:5-formyltetrahydrofolate cyclo-ligase
VTNGHRGTVHLSQPEDQEAAALAQRKVEARAAAQARRDSLSADLQARAGESVRDHVLAAIPIPKGCVVSAFWSMGSEIETRPLLHALHERGHTIGLPVTIRRGLPLLFRAWVPGLALVSGGFGTEVPGPAQAEVVPRVVLVPLLAFDRAGYRLGYGGGFYDRTLAALRAKGPVLAVGLAFAAQEVEAVPRGEHDQRLDWIVTEAGAVAFQ